MAGGLMIRGSIPDTGQICFSSTKLLRLATGTHAASYEVAVAWGSPMTFIKSPG